MGKLLRNRRSYGPYFDLWLKQGAKELRVHSYVGMYRIRMFNVDKILRFQDFVVTHDTNQ